MKQVQGMVTQSTDLVVGACFCSPGGHRNRARHLHIVFPSTLSRDLPPCAPHFHPDLAHCSSTCPLPSQPVNSSRGRGIRMVLKPSELSRDTKDVLIQHYIDRWVWGGGAALETGCGAVTLTGVCGGEESLWLRRECPHTE